MPWRYQAICRFQHISRHKNHKANMWAQQASGYDVDGQNFHIKREPMRRIAVLEAAKLARPVPLCSLADEPARPVPETGQASLPARFSSIRLKLLLIDAKADSSD